MNKQNTGGLMFRSRLTILAGVWARRMEQCYELFGRFKVFASPRPMVAAYFLAFFRRSISPLLIVALCSGSPSFADDFDETNDRPRVYFVDENGVDIATASLALTIPLVSIGTGEEGKLEYVKRLIKRKWKDNTYGKIERQGNWNSVRVSLGFAEYYFNDVPNDGQSFPVGPYGATSDEGTALTYNAANQTYTATTSNGTIAVYSRAMADYSGKDSYGFPNDDIARLLSVTSPNGIRTTYNYKSTTMCVVPWNGGACVNQHFARLQSITNSLGYQLKFEYESNTAPTGSDYSLLNTWRTIRKVIAVNNNIEACSPIADLCSLTGNWPSATFAKTAPVGAPPADKMDTETITNALGQVTEYGYRTYWLPASGAYGSRRLVSIRKMSLPAGVVTITYESSTSSVIAAVTNAAGTWTYDYSDTTNYGWVKDPYLKTRSVDSDFDSGEDLENQEVRDELGRVTSYDYTADGWNITRITRPEGDYTEYTLDARDNVTRITRVGKVGSGLTSTFTSAVFPATCSNRLTCNKPSARLDARGAQTDFVYDPTHGGTLTETGPAPTVGATRPVITYTYGTAAGSDGTTLYRLSSKTEKIDATTSATTTYSYDAIHRMAPKEMVVSSGVDNLRTCFKYDKVGNLISQTEPRAGLSSCP